MDPWEATRAKPPSSISLPGGEALGGETISQPGTRAPVAGHEGRNGQSYLVHARGLRGTGTTPNKEIGY